MSASNFKHQASSESSPDSSAFKPRSSVSHPSPIQPLAVLRDSKPERLNLKNFETKPKVEFPNPTAQNVSPRFDQPTRRTSKGSASSAAPPGNQESVPWHQPPLPSNDPSAWQHSYGPADLGHEPLIPNNPDAYVVSAVGIDGSQYPHDALTYCSHFHLLTCQIRR